MLVLFVLLSLLLVGIATLFLGTDSHGIRTEGQRPDRGLPPSLIVR